jgi:hypothetical protein
LLKIPTDSKCDFIKWELKLKNRNDSTSEYQLIALYGEAKPNTNGFMNGGNRLSIAGKLSVHRGSTRNPLRRIYQLNSNSLKSALILVELDENILHFADEKNNLLVGNGGWGYVLNGLK